MITLSEANLTIGLLIIFVGFIAKASITWYKIMAQEKAMKEMQSHVALLETTLETKIAAAEAAVNAKVELMTATLGTKLDRVVDAVGNLTNSLTRVETKLEERTKTA